MKASFLEGGRSSRPMKVNFLEEGPDLCRLIFKYSMRKVQACEG